MARLNEILVGRFNRGMQRLFGIKGPPPVATLAPEMMPVHVVPNGVETRYLETWNRYAASVVLGPTAANVNVARLLNPANTNMVAVIESILLTNFAPTTQGFSVSISAALPNLLALDTSATVSVDARNTAQSVCIASHNNAAVAVGTAIDGVAFPAQGSFQLINDENQEIVLVPNASLSIISSVVNQQWQYSLLWRERFLEESERI